MAYSKTVWVNGITPVNSSNMNNIENGITNVDASLTNYVSSNDIAVAGKASANDYTKVTGYSSDTGTANAFIVTLSPTPAFYAPGMAFNFKATNSNTGACTINVNGLGVKTIKKNNSLDLQNGDIISGQMVWLIYDGTYFQMLGNLYPVFKKITVDTGTTTDYDTIKVTGTINNYFQTNIQNKSNGTTASSDIVATADTGTETSLYIDMGINSSGYTGASYGVGSALDTYVISTGNDMYITNKTNNKNIYINTTGTGKVSINGKTAQVINSGTTANRPTSNLETGLRYFDTTLNKPIWRNTANTGWVDSNGTSV